MKKNKDEWEEFLKQREKEKASEDAELQELLKHAHDNKKSSEQQKEVDNNLNKLKNIDNNPTYNNDDVTDDINDEDYDYVPFDVDSLTEEEILGGVTSYDTAYELYIKANDLYNQAFELWETDPDSIEFQRKLEEAEIENDIAEKRLDILEEKGLHKQNIKKDTFQHDLNKDSYKQSKGNKRTNFMGIIIFIAIVSMFVGILLGSNGVKYAGAIFPCTMVMMAFVCIYMFFIAPQFKILQKAIDKTETDKNNQETSNKGNKQITKKKLLLNKIVVLLFLGCLMGFLFILIFGGIKKSYIMISIGAIGFIGLILIIATISSIVNKTKKRK